MTLEFRVTKRSICSAGSGADWSNAFDLCIQKGWINHTGEVHHHPQVSVRTGELPPFVPEGPEVADQVVDGVTVEAVGVHGNVVLTGGHHVLDMAIEFARMKLHGAEVLKAGGQERMDRAAVAVDNVSDVVLLRVAGAQDGIAVDQHEFDHKANDPDAAGGGMHHESAQFLFPVMPVGFLKGVLQHPGADDPLIFADYYVVEALGARRLFEGSCRAVEQGPLVQGFNEGIGYAVFRRRRLPKR